MHILSINQLIFIVILINYLNVSQLLHNDFVLSTIYQTKEELEDCCCNHVSRIERIRKDSYKIFGYVHKFIFTMTTIRSDNKLKFSVKRLLSIFICMIIRFLDCPFVNMSFYTVAQYIANHDSLNLGEKKEH